MNASQMHVSATTATGQPLMAAGPIPQFIQYQHPPHFQSQYGMPMRVYPEPQPPQLQFLTQTPPSTTPSPGQPHQTFHPQPPQPSPAGGGLQPTHSFTPQTQPPTYQFMCLHAPQLMSNIANPYFPSSTPQHPQQNQPIQLVMQQHTTQ